MMISADNFTDKNGNVICLEDEIIWNNLRCLVVGINLHNDTLVIKRIDPKTEYGTMTLYRAKADIEIVSIP